MAIFNSYVKLPEGNPSHGHRTWKNHTPGHGSPADDARPHNEAVKTRRALQKDLAIEGKLRMGCYTLQNGCICLKNCLYIYNYSVYIYIHTYYYIYDVCQILFYLFFGL